MTGRIREEGGGGAVNGKSRKQGEADGRREMLKEEERSAN